MPVQKVFPSPDEALADVFDGAVIMFGGFAGAGVPEHLIAALLRKGTRGITAICNGAGRLRPDRVDVAHLVEQGRVRKLIASFPVAGSPSEPGPVERLWREGLLEVEIVPQGTLAERIRAGGAGIGAFWTPTGVGTPFEQGKERRVFPDGREYLLEYPLQADFALIRAHRADTLGNLVYRKAARNFNPIMATAAKVTIVEVEEVVEPGAIPPEAVVTPALYVDRIVQVKGRPEV